MTGVKTRVLRTLACIPSGQKARIVRVTAGRGLSGRLAAMGLLPHQEITVVRNGRSGPCVILVKRSKVALGRGMAEAIEVL